MSTQDIFKLTTFEGFRDYYDAEKKTHRTYQEAYDATEKEHVARFGKRKYASWACFQVILSRKAKNR